MMMHSDDCTSSAGDVVGSTINNKTSLMMSSSPLNVASKEESSPSSSSLPPPPPVSNSSLLFPPLQQSAAGAPTSSSDNSDNAPPPPPSAPEAKAAYDPYNPEHVRQRASLLDGDEDLEDGDDDEETVVFDAVLDDEDRGMIAGTSAEETKNTLFLEMEDEEEEEHYLLQQQQLSACAGNSGKAFNSDGYDVGGRQERDDDDEGEEPIRTSSGLLLTHRKSPAGGITERTGGGTAVGVQQRRPYPYLQERLEVEHPYSSSPPGSAGGGGGGSNNPSYYAGGSSSYGSGGNTTFAGGMMRGWNGGGGGSSSNGNPIAQAKRLLSYVKLWVVLSTLLLVAGTIVVIQHVRHEFSSSSSAQQGGADGSNGEQLQESSATSLRVVSYQNDQQPYYEDNSNIANIADTTVVLLPLDMTTSGYNNNYHHRRRLLHREIHHQYMNEMEQYLVSEFEEWMARHDRRYDTVHEQQHRFGIWVDNHHKTREKNAAHGPCPLTGRPVFGSTLFQDLSHDEFKSTYLTGYNAMHKRRPVSREHHRRRRERRLLPPVLGVDHTDRPNRHGDVHRRMQQSFWKSEDSIKQASYSSCDWYDVSCLLRYIFSTYFYGLGMTMEPAYDSDSYPMAVDWRDVGAVTKVHSQGNCGACWAITAVETVESGEFIATGTLNDLSESEVIVCATECEMCSGGWPQEAFDYIMDNNGVPLEEDLPYDGDFLLALTYAYEDGSGSGDNGDGQYSMEDVQGYMKQICPNGGGGNSGSQKSGSGDNADDDGGGYSYQNFDRYGSIKGYGYATDKCVCYTDGSGCDCDSQNEGLAVRNLATYGPAVVCVDASVWQDYSGGIITANSGCSSGFMDVNHCVQAVGYAFTTDDYDGEGEEDQQQQSGSGSQHSGSGSRDSSSRIGYWIIRNQWSSYWGMEGYAYVAMGSNTCGLLNDMIQVYS